MKRDVPRDFQDVSILSFSVLTRAVSLSTTDSLQLVQLHCFFDYSHSSQKLKNLQHNQESSMHGGKIWKW